MNWTYKNINTPEISIFLFIIILGTLFSLNNWFDYLIFYNSSDYQAVSITACNEKNQNLNSELFEEINREIDKNNIASQIKLDSTSNTVVMNQINLDFIWFIDWCIYISNQALTNMRNKKNNSGYVSSTIFVYQYSN